jgi:predicted ArsR family transcriptional regulator
MTNEFIEILETIMQRTGWNKRLLASTRGQILALLRMEDRTVNDLATALHLTDNAVRTHLLSLERDGFVQQRGRRPGTRKPHAAYGLTPEAEEVFPKPYGAVLNRLVNVISKRLPPQQMRATMRAVGRALAQDYVPALQKRGERDRLNTALKLLADLGGAAKPFTRDGKQFIHGRNGCPLAAVTADHPSACLIVEAMLSELMGRPVRKCCEYNGAPHCCFELDR